jgi:hypothetical protein
LLSKQKKGEKDQLSLLTLVRYRKKHISTGEKVYCTQNVKNRQVLALIKNNNGG